LPELPVVSGRAPRRSRSLRRPAASFALSYLALLQLEGGRLADALATARGGLAIAERTGQHYRDAELLRLEGEILHRAPGHEPDAAELLFETAVETARRQEALSLELTAATSLARLLAERGRSREAHAALAPVYARFSEGFGTPDLVEARRLLDHLS
jgi:predicted ATPase